MNTIYLQIHNILTTSPGNLAFHLIIAFTTAGALQGTLIRWQRNDSPALGKTALGLGMLLIFQLILFIGAGLAWGLNSLSEYLLPLLDRTITCLSIVTITWLWIFPTMKRASDNYFIVGLAVIAAGGMVNFLWVRQSGGGAPFYGTWYNLSWEAASLFILLIGGGLTLVLKPDSWAIGLVMFSFLSLGHILYMVLPPMEGDFPGVVRLSRLAAYPMLFALPRRFIFHEKAAAADSKAGQDLESSPPSNRKSTDLDLPLIEDVIKITPLLPREKLLPAVARVISRSIHPDLTLLTTFPDAQQEMEICCTYDLIQEESLSGITFTSDQLPLISTALKKNQPLRLPGSSSSADFTNLGELLRLNRVGHLLAAPLALPSIREKVGVILLSPYSNRHWGKGDEKNLLDLNHAIQAALDMELNGEDRAFQDQLRKIQMELEYTREELKDVTVEREALREENKILKSTSVEKVQFKESADRSREVIADLERHNKKLQEQLEILSQEISLDTDVGRDHELQLALREIAILKEELALHSGDKSREEEAPASMEPLSALQVSSISRLTRELRQPLASMRGYTDILLGESVGLLGSLQKQFLERIQASIERITALLENLIEKAVIDPRDPGTNHYEIALSEVIDRAINAVGEDIMERKISIRVDLPKRLPRLYIDEYSMHQILVNLLKNAASATQPGGEIFIRARSYEEVSDQDFALIQVADQGGGIPVEELPGVFSRLNKNSRRKVQGTGQPGAELSIVKTLVEAQQGRIWVDSEDGEGATFSLLIPLATRESWVT